MIVPVQPQSYGFGYLPRTRRKALSLFFSGANVAFRLSALKPREFFDEGLATGEDTDAGIRMAELGELFSVPSARVTHTSNLSLRKVAQQWRAIARDTVRVVRKHSTGGLEVILCHRSTARGASRFRTLFYRSEGPLAVIFVSPFAAMNACAWLTLITGGHPLAWTALAASTFVYVQPDLALEEKDLRRKLLFTAQRLGINSILLYGSLIEGLRHGVLYINYELA